MARIINFGELFFERPPCLTRFSAQTDSTFQILAVALACSVAVTLFCLTARTSDPTNQKIAAPAVIKAKTGIVVTSDDAKATR
jgi:hypothetical protein